MTRSRRPAIPLAGLLALSALTGCGDPRGGAEPSPPSSAASAVERAPGGVATDPGSATSAPSVAESPALGRRPSPDSPSSPGFVVWESNRSGRWRLWISALDGRAPRQLTADEPGRRHCCPQVAPDGRKIAYLSLPGGRDRYLDDRAVGALRWIAPDGRSGATLVDEARTYFEHRAVVWVDPDRLRYIAVDRSVRTLDLVRGDDRSTLAPEQGAARRWLVDRSGRWAVTGLAALAPVEGGRLGAITPLPGCQPIVSADGRWAIWTAGAGGPIDRFDLERGRAETIVEKGDRRLPADRGYLYFPALSSDRTLLAFAASDGEHDHWKADYDLFVAEVDPTTLELLAAPWPVAPDDAVDRFPDVWRGALELGRRIGEVPLEVRLEPPDGRSWEWRLGDRVEVGGALETVVTAPAVLQVAARSGDEVRHGVVVATAPVVEPPLRQRWPARTDGLIWVWAAGGPGPTTPLDRAPGPIGLDLGRGRVVAGDSAELLHRGLGRTNRFTLEIVADAPPTSSGELAAVVAIGRDAGRENLVLGQRGGRWRLRLRVGPKRDPYDEIDLGPVGVGRRHFVVRYTPGRLDVFRDGEAALSTDRLRGHFFHWRPYPLVLGDRWQGGAPWRGRIEAIAIYDRLISEAEIAANARTIASSLPDGSQSR